MAVPVWNSGLTLDQIRQIESVKKSSLSAILGPSYISYDEALKSTNLDRLSSRRESISLRFIKKNMKTEHPFLSLRKKTYNTRSDPNLTEEFQCRTK